jgi:hypothetical protein
MQTKRTAWLALSYMTVALALPALGGCHREKVREETVIEKPVPADEWRSGRDLRERREVERQRDIDRMRDRDHD